MNGTPNSSSSGASQRSILLLHSTLYHRLGPTRSTVLTASRITLQYLLPTPAQTCHKKDPRTTQQPMHRSSSPRRTLSFSVYRAKIHHYLCLRGIAWQMPNTPVCRCPPTKSQSHSAPYEHNVAIPYPRSQAKRIMLWLRRRTWHKS